MFLIQISGFRKAIDYHSHSLGFPLGAFGDLGGMSCGRGGFRGLNPGGSTLSWWFFCMVVVIPLSLPMTLVARLINRTVIQLGSGLRFCDSQSFAAPVFLDDLRRQLTGLRCRTASVELHRADDLERTD
jgi:hypothetical protein